MVSGEPLWVAPPCVARRAQARAGLLLRYVGPLAFVAIAADICPHSTGVRCQMRYAIDGPRKGGGAAELHSAKSVTQMAQRLTGRKAQRRSPGRHFCACTACRSRLVTTQRLDRKLQMRGQPQLGLGPHWRSNQCRVPSRCFRSRRLSHPLRSVRVSVRHQASSTLPRYSLLPVWQLPWFSRCTAVSLLSPSVSICRCASLAELSSRQGSGSLEHDIEFAPLRRGARGWV